MKLKKIKVRREVVRCTQCGKANALFYLSDFLYGEKLIIYDEGRKYAFIDLKEDSVYNEFIALLSKIMLEHGKYAENMLIDDLFSITCDPILNYSINFGSNKRKCIFCDSYVFEADLLEPEKIGEIEVPIVTHEIWKRLNSIQKRKKIEDTLRNRGVIK